MSKMKDYLSDLEELSMEHSRLIHLYQNAIKLENKLFQANQELIKENIQLKKELETFKVMYPLLEEGFNGQYLFAKRLLIEIEKLKGFILDINEVYKSTGDADTFTDEFVKVYDKYNDYQSPDKLYANILKGNEK